MTKLRKSGVESARRGSADAKAWTVITPAQKREAIPYSEVSLASEIDVDGPSRCFGFVQAYDEKLLSYPRSISVRVVSLGRASPGRFRSGTPNYFSTVREPSQLGKWLQ